jgi:hypothetical protein
MKIGIGIPFYKFMEGKAVESLITMMADIHNRGDVYLPIFAHSIAIDRARNMMVKVMVEQLPDVDYFLFIDTDQVYSAQALYTLIEKMEEHGFNQLSAAYIARGMPGHYAHCALRADGLAGKIPAPQQGIVECHSVGFGFNVMRRDFLIEMHERHKPLFKDHDVELMGEDVYFCALQRGEGVPVRFDADTKVGHISSIVL